MTNTKNKLRSLFLTGLMIVSVFAGVVIIPGTAVANVTAIDNGAADNVDAGVSSATQTVTFDIDTDSNSNTETIELDISSASAVPTSIETSDTSDVSVEGTASANQVRRSGSVVEIDIDSTGGSQTDATVTVTLTHDTSSITSTTSINGYTATVPRTGDSTSTGQFSIVANSGSDRFVPEGGLLFQGEGSFQLGPNDLSPASLERTSGANEGVILEEPLPEGQPQGTYAVDGNSNNFDVTVQRPIVRDLEVTTSNGADVAGGSVNIGSNTQLNVEAAYNFQTSESLEVTVEEESGLDVTNEVVSSQPGVTGSGDITVALNTDALSNEQYTITVEGADDLDFGVASQSTDLTVTSGENVRIEADSDEVTRGEDVGFTVDRAQEGELHLVRIDGGDIQQNPGAIFRNVGDTVATGKNNSDAFALVEIDGGSAAGSIDTTGLDEVETTVEVFSEADSPTEADFNSGNGLDSSSTQVADDVDIEITEGGVTLNNPTGTYVVGSEVTINGTTTQGVDQVALFVRDEGAYQLLTDDLNVDGSDEFELEDIAISDDSNAEINTDLLSLTGTYRIAAVDAEDSELDTTGQNLDTTQDATDVTSATGSQSTLRVTETSLTVDYISIMNGQVSVADTTSPGLEINGTAPGQDQVSVSFYGPRGKVSGGDISVDDDGTFSSDSVPIGSNIDQGTVVMSVFSEGRDNQAGDGDFPGASDRDQFLTNLNGQSLTQEQVLDRVAAQTTEDTGSDDISRAFQFRLTSSRTSVNTVTSANASNPNTVVAGDDAIVSGVTNRQPDDTVLTVEVIDGPTTSEFDIETTEQWGTDGQWALTMESRDPAPGNYTVEVDDGGNADVLSFQVVNQTVQPEASVSFTDQTLSDTGTVTVASVTMSEGGFVTIHDSTLADGATFESVVGTSDYLEPGTTQNVEVTVATTPGQHFAMPHLDTNGNEAYDFVSSDGAEDAPYTTAQGDIVLDGAQVSAPATPTPTPTDAPEDPTPMPTDAPEDPTPTEEPDDETPTDTETTSDGQPGFGLALSLIALIGAALIALRRRD